MNTAVYLLACYGAVYVLSSSYIFNWPRAVLKKSRFLGRMLGCYFCTGMWASLGLSCLVSDSWLERPLYALAGAATAQILHIVVYWWTREAGICEECE